MRPVRSALLAAVLSASLLAACSSTGDGSKATGDGATTGAETTSAAPTTPAPTTPEPTTAEPTTPEPTTPEAEKAAAGTPEDPIFGDQLAVFTLKDSGDVLTVGLGPTNWNADDAVLAENSTNKPPEPGKVYVLQPVTVSFKGAGTATPWYEIFVQYTGPNGEKIKEFGTAVAPDSFLHTGDVTDGMTVTGNMIFQMPVDQVGTGLWSITYKAKGEPIWFRPNPA